MSARQAFEAWYCKKFGVTPLSRSIRMHLNNQGRYSNQAVQVRWESWKQAWDTRAAAAA